MKNKNLSKTIKKEMKQNKNLRQHLDSKKINK